MSVLADHIIDDRLTAIFRKLFQDDGLTVSNETTSADIEDWDSLNNIKLVIAVEKAFGVKFTLAEIVPLQNVGDLKALMRQKGVMPASPAAIPVAAERDYEAIAVEETADLPVVVTAEMVAQFAALSGDFNPLHMDAQYAQASPLGSRVVHGMLVAAFISQLIGMRLPGRRALIHSIQLEFVAPVRIGDRLLLQGRVTEKHDAFRCLSIALRVRRHDAMLVVRGSAQVGMLPDDGARNG